jgi:FkbM family methyltransferase
MSSSTTLTLVNGVRIVVPESLDQVITYVLSEQQDWFEDEIKFLRHLLQQGDKAIDIGANYGVYTLSMAQTVGPSGHIWAFEPASDTARMLAEGIAANCFSQVTLGQLALSNVKGTAQFFLDHDSVMNSLTPGNTPGAVETVSVLSLDDCLVNYGWQSIDFVKIDAEGEELNIIKGGGRFFSEFSPLVQHEVSDDPQIRQQMEQEFTALGYKTYLLVPGLNLLRPFDVMKEDTGFLINLFSCKPDRAAQLAARGFLVDTVEPYVSGTGLERFLEKIRTCPEYRWQRSLCRFPYGELLNNIWGETITAGQSSGVEEVLSFYAASRDAFLSAGERLSALTLCYTRFQEICQSEPSFLRLASFSRVARAYGARAKAVHALKRQLDVITTQNQVAVGEPFLVPSERFDVIPPGDGFGKWILTAILEEYERIMAYSTFYTGDSSLERLEAIRDSGFSCEEMQRRLKFLQIRLTQAGYYQDESSCRPSPLSPDASP